MRDIIEDEMFSSSVIKDMSFLDFDYVPKILVHRDERYDGDADFLSFMLRMEKQNTSFHLSANGIPIYI